METLKVFISSVLANCVILTQEAWSTYIVFVLRSLLSRWVSGVLDWRKCTRLDHMMIYKLVSFELGWSIWNITRLIVLSSKLAFLRDAPAFEMRRPNGLIRERIICLLKLAELNSYDTCVDTLFHGRQEKCSAYTSCVRHSFQLNHIESENSLIFSPVTVEMVSTFPPEFVSAKQQICKRYYASQSTSAKYYCIEAFGRMIYSWVRAQ